MTQRNTLRRLNARPAFTLVALTGALILAGCNANGGNGNGQTDPDDNGDQNGDDNLTTPEVSRHHPVDKEWRLVWSDEFDGHAIDPAKWSFEQNCWGGGNDELQCYTNRDDNAYIEDGRLIIKAQREDFTGPADTEDSDAYDPDNTRTQPYTSARLRTINKGDWRYGRFEIRAKLPQGQGTWPAVWMLPTDWVYGGWAASGEIDIMEAVNIGTQSDAPDAEAGTPEHRVHGTLHYGRAWPNNVYSGTSYDFGPNESPADGFHHYAIEWQEGEIRWYVDGQHYATHTMDGWYTQYIDDESGEMVTGENAAPFNQDFHLIMNLAVGGNWAGAVNDGGVDESVFPQTLEIDYVRVYQCDVDAVTGAGCETRSEDATLIEGNTPPEIIEPDEDLGAAPLFTIFDGELTAGLDWNAYDPNNVINATPGTDGDRQFLNIDKAGATGNFYASYTPRLDLSHWGDDGDLVFDLRVNSLDEGVALLVKIDGGWPNVSDLTVTLPEVGAWAEVRLNIADLVASGNSIVAGSVDLADVLNPVVFEPNGAMNFDVANIRYEQ